ncbi:LacI family DNA-binding transcriptional regulator [Paraflavitalea speifideaquila]|uniref:LacI family DNA-binding transcriptional regulator n=1 Tax=Paraflavitalea speifideaquila TaxID=3076558 RepID=UPI0028ED77C0|nr:LacI family DNA-binding transcriptional regulator [Paraflavitalea speifideiaquila]
MKRVSLKDIAKMVGASPSTVSFILNGKASQMRISEELKNKVLAAAKKMGYQPNQVAVSLRTGQTKILGLLVEDISNNFLHPWLKSSRTKRKSLAIRWFIPARKTIVKRA